jgi:hypothetical protein
VRLELCLNKCQWLDADARALAEDSAKEKSMGRGLLLWLIGIPIPIIILIWLLGGLH